MSLEPLVTVLVVTYNQAPYIGACLDSIIAQKAEFPFQIMVGEDCSTDPTQQIVRDYEHRYPDVVRMITGQKNVGLLENVRRVERAARGKYIAYCGGDDIWHHPEKLARQVALMEENPACALTHTDYVSLVGDRRVPNTNRDLAKAHQGRVRDALLRGNFVCASSACLRMSVLRSFEKTPLAQKPYLTEDFARWLYASTEGDVRFIDEPMVTYRVIEGSIMRANPAKNARLWDSVRQVGIDYCQLYGGDPASLRHLECTANSHILCMSAYAKQYDVFDREYAWMLANNPDWLKSRKYRLISLLARYRLGWAAALTRRIWRRLS